MRPPKPGTAVGIGAILTGAANVIGVPGMIDDAATWGSWLAPLHLEVWGWWALMLAGAGLVMWSYFADRHSGPTYDVPLKEAVRRITKTPASVFDGDELDGALISACYDALAEIRERAINQQIHVWARSVEMPWLGNWEREPRAPVPLNIWQSRKFDALEFIQDMRGELKSEGVGAIHYGDFWLWSRDVDRLWPKTRRIKWRMPWVTE